MLSVYLIHSQIYYGIGGIDYGYLLMPFYVNAFFFVSGYLLYRKYMMSDRSLCRTGFANILFRIVIPTILFSAMLYLPKMFFHQTQVSIFGSIAYILGGVSYWFTAALAISEFIMMALMMIRPNSKWFYLTITILLFTIGLFLNFKRTSNDPIAFLPWFYQTGLEYSLMMAIGGLYFCYELEIDYLIRKTIVLVLIIYAIILYDDWGIGDLKMIGLGGICNVKGCICALFGIILVVALAKQFHPSRWIKFISRNSIIFYFFSGMYPAAIGVIAKQIFPHTNCIVTLLVFAMSFACGAMTTILIGNYMPYLTDLRKIKGISFK